MLVCDRHTEAPTTTTIFFSLFSKDYRVVLLLLLCDECMSSADLFLWTLLALCDANVSESIK